MKHIFGIIMCLVLLVCSSCATNEITSQQDASDKPPSLTVSSSAENDIIEFNTQAAYPSDQEPEWAQLTQLRGKLYQNLNLDGIGDSDDEVYISVIENPSSGGSNRLTATALRIRLGTGQVITEIISTMGFPYLQTGNLLSADRDAIVLKIKDDGNYSANVIYVYDLFKTSETAHGRLVKYLDTSQYQMPDTYMAAGGCEIVDVEGKDTQGLAIYLVGPKAEFRESKLTLWWDGSGWQEINHDQ